MSHLPPELRLIEDAFATIAPELRSGVLRDGHAVADSFVVLTEPSNARIAVINASAQLDFVMVYDESPVIGFSRPAVSGPLRVVRGTHPLVIVSSLAPRRSGQSVIARFEARAVGGVYGPAARLAVRWRTEALRRLSDVGEVLF